LGRGGECLLKFPGYSFVLIAAAVVYENQSGAVMLKVLRIKNFAIIDELEVAFQDGLNVITGETGAGKSIIIGAVSLILGDRASSDQIRTSEDSASVEALFSMEDNPDLQQKLEQLGFDPQPELVIRRVISRSGKNRVYINGQTANLGMLASLSETLINICGQHEHQVILESGNHIDILDEFGGLLQLRSAFKKQYDECLALREQLEKLNTLSENKARAEEFLRFQFRDIEDAAPVPGEDAALADEKKIIRSAGFLQEQAAACYHSLYAKEGAILSELGSAISRIKEIKKIDSGLDLSLQELDTAVFSLEDAAAVLGRYIEKICFDPARLEQIEDRLEILGRLKRKYGGSLEEVLKKKEDFRRELEGYTSVDEEISHWAARLEKSVNAARETASTLSAQRKQSAKILKKSAEDEIRSLRMENASFEVFFREREQGKDPLSVLDSKGMDDIEFYLSTNPGEDMKPLNRIASGGELSRIVLALKKALAKTGSVGTIIFDEVDSGIGGAVAEVVGEKLRDVSRSHQVICITHLPQIACVGDWHYIVSKQFSEGRTNTQIRLLAASERPGEIARMLAGVDITEKTRAHAREMLNRAGLGRKQPGKEADLNQNTKPGMEQTC
jgi:DNA repair protein RecN (Recombination protein N)